MVNDKLFTYVRVDGIDLSCFGRSSVSLDFFYVSGRTGSYIFILGQGVKTPCFICFLVALALDPMLSYYLCLSYINRWGNSTVDFVYSMVDFLYCD